MASYRLLTGLSLSFSTPVHGLPDGVQDVLGETNPNLTIKGATYDKLKDWIQATLFNWHLI